MTYSSIYNTLKEKHRKRGEKAFEQKFNFNVNASENKTSFEIKGI
jgi:hypothetical protein